MWARLDDALIDHQKIFDAGAALGRNGPALALALYSLGLMYANKHLTDGFLSEAVVRNFRHVDDPLRVAGALTKVALFERVSGGFKIHDFHDYNPSARSVKDKRKEDRRRKTASSRNGS
jgi:hypothetical protein